MRQWLFLLAFVLGTTHLHAQRFLTLPDLSTLATPDSGLLSVDPRSGLIYATYYSTLLSGVKSNGLGRLVGGVPDLSWRPALRLYVQGAPVFAPNGNIYFAGQTAGSVDGTSVVSVATAAGSEPIVRFTPPAPSAGGRSRLLAIAGGVDHWLYFTTRESVGIATTTRIGRLDTRDHHVDAWTYELPATDAFPVVGPDGAAYVVGSAFLGDAAVPRTFVRLSTGAVATPLWRQEILAARSKVEVDAHGRLYVLTMGTYGYPSDIIRLGANGELDTSWSSQWVNGFVERSATAKNFDMLVAGDDLIVTVSPDVIAGASPVEMARFDSRGVELLRTTVPAANGRSNLQRPLMGVANGAILYTTGDEVWSVDAVTLRTRNSFSYALGRPAEIWKVLALPDGGRLIFGRFDVFYGGQRYRSLLRIGADGNVVQDWQVNVKGDVFDVFLTPRGIVVFGAMTMINGVAASNSATPASGVLRPSVALVSLATGTSGASVDPQWGAQWPTSAYRIAYDDADQFFAASGTQTVLSLKTLSLKDNVVSSEWSMPYRGEGVSLDTDRLGGLWLFWEVSGFGSPTVFLIQRLDFATRALTASIANNRISFQARSLLSSRQHAYIADKRYGLTQPGTEDPAWTRRAGTLDASWAPQTLSANYLYWTQFVDGTNMSKLRRSPLSGEGEADPAWSAPAPRIAGSFAAFTKDVEPQSSDDIEYVASQGDDARMITTRSLASEDKTVIEYFNRDVQRYFLTGRVDEQSVLDALPASFVRTGMKFRARSALGYADQPETPVCRFYAAPDRGGSNTHFYGASDDCAVLNTVTSLRFEGFDFAAIKPTHAACPATAPNPVYRLFNNKSATNAGNHRYVVSIATKARMVAQGWVDEGVVFCSTSVADSAL